MKGIKLCLNVYGCDYVDISNNYAHSLCFSLEMNWFIQRQRVKARQGILSKTTAELGCVT